MACTLAQNRAASTTSVICDLWFYTVRPEARKPQRAQGAAASAQG